MNILILKEYSDDRIVYKYQPEGKGECGEVIYLFEDGTAKVARLAENESAWYSGMATRKVEEFVKKKNLPLDFTQAWY
jgi:hypothetical protein